MSANPVSMVGYVGMQPASAVWAPSTTRQMPLGTVIDAVDPYFGWGRYVYAVSAAAQEMGSLVYFTNAYVATDIPNTANTGFPIAVAKTAMGSGEYGWYQTEGLCAMSTAASVATGVAVGIGGAGQAGTNSAGKQILGARVAQASTFTLTKTGTTQLGANKKTIIVPNIEGLFTGLAVSGTGVGASAVITALDPGGNYIVVDIDSTAAGTVTLTFTYTGFLLVMMNAPHVQGAIT